MIDLCEVHGEVGAMRDLWEVHGDVATLSDEQVE